MKEVALENIVGKGKKCWYTLIEMAFENIVRKGENAGNQHFLLFPQCFLSYER